MFEHIDFRSGEVRYCSGCLEDEDILQVAYPNNYILDLGWYGQNRGFVLYIIRDYEWSVPVVKYTFFKSEQIEEILNSAIQRIEKEAAISKPYYGELWETEEIIM